MVASNFLQLLDFFVSYVYFKELGVLIHLGVFGCESTGVSPALKCLIFLYNVGGRELCCKNCAWRLTSPLQRHTCGSFRIVHSG
jgi:hypothetical protein